MIAGLTILFCVIVLAGVDAYLMYSKGPKATMSAFVWKFIHDWPIVLYLAGIITGHLVWPLAQETIGCVCR